MKIKLAPELQFGDIIIHNHDRYLVNRYCQGVGAGHFTWGEYGVLYVNKYNPAHIVNNERHEILEAESNFWTYKNYPFIVLNDGS